MELKDILHQSLDFISKTTSNFAGIETYLFGSACRTPDKFSDIDIAILYSSDQELRSFLNCLCNFEYYPLFHFTCLTVTENIELQFLQTENALKLPIEENLT